MLAVLGGDDAFGSEASDKANERKRKVDAAIARTEEHDTLLRDLRDEVRRTQDRVKNREQFLEDEDRKRSREVSEACQKALAKAGGPIGDETNAIIRRCSGSRGAHAADRDRAEVLQKCSVYADEARADVSALRGSTPTHA